MTYPATIAIVAETFGQYLLEGIRQYTEVEESYVPLIQKLLGFSLLCMFVLSLNSDVHVLVSRWPKTKAFPFSEVSKPN